MLKLKYLTLLRPHHWIKNLLLFFPAFFGGKITDIVTLQQTFLAFLAFCTLASFTYIINDIRDIETDRRHSLKKNRSIASGEIKIAHALFYSFALFVFSFINSFFVSSFFWIYLLLYLLISLSYTFSLKSVVILDLFAISSGFLVRVLAGGSASGITVSNWLFMTVFLVSMFLATGKRMGEIILLGNEAGNHRKSLEGYRRPFLQGCLWFAASAALVTYSLYTLEQGGNLFYSVPLAAFGLLRYIYLIDEGKGDPTEVLFMDGQIMLTGILWAMLIGTVIY